MERSDVSSTKAALANDLFGSDDDDDLPIKSRSRAVVTDKDDEADDADRVKSGSDEDEADRAGKELSDLEEEDADREAPSRHDLFGSDDDELDGDDAAKSKEPEEPAFLPPITLELPTLADPADAQLYSFKLPQSVSIEPRPYARGAFLEAHPDRRVKELVANTMRWRTATSPQGEPAVRPLLLSALISALGLCSSNTLTEGEQRAVCALERRQHDIPRR